MAEELLRRSRVVVACGTKVNENVKNDIALAKRLGIDIVNIGLHFILKNVRPYAASCSEA